MSFRGKRNQKAGRLKAGSVALVNSSAAAQLLTPTEPSPAQPEWSPLSPVKHPSLMEGGLPSSTLTPNQSRARKKREHPKVGSSWKNASTGFIFIKVDLKWGLGRRPGVSELFHQGPVKATVWPTACLKTWCLVAPKTCSRMALGGTLRTPLP